MYSLYHQIRPVTYVIALRLADTVTFNQMRVNTRGSGESTLSLSINSDRLLKARPGGHTMCKKLSIKVETKSVALRLHLICFIASSEGLFVSGLSLCRTVPVISTQRIHSRISDMYNI